MDAMERRRAQAFAQRARDRARNPERALERQADQLIEGINRRMPPNDQEAPAYSRREFRRRFQSRYVPASSLTEHRMREMAENPLPERGPAYTPSARAIREWRQSSHKIARVEFVLKTKDLTPQQRTALLLRGQEVTLSLVAGVAQCADVCRVLGVAGETEVEAALLSLAGRGGRITDAALGKRMGIKAQAIQGLYDRGRKHVIKAVEARTGLDAALRRAREDVENWVRTGRLRPDLPPEQYEDEVRMRARAIQWATARERADFYEDEARETMREACKGGVFGRTLTAEEFEWHVQRIAEAMARDAAADGYMGELQDGDLMDTSLDVESLREEFE